MQNGADERSRTSDLLITNQLLYQLSYVGIERLNHESNYTRAWFGRNDLLRTIPNRRFFEYGK